MGCKPLSSCHSDFIKDCQRWTSATTAAIAKASGKAHGTVFVHFGTRDELVDELVEEVGRAMSQRLADTQCTRRR
jgi:AcrR family transcriptional regulator